MGASQLANIDINKLYLIICEAIYKDPMAAQDKASRVSNIWSPLKIKLNRPNFAKITKANADKSIPNKIGKTYLKEDDNYNEKENLIIFEKKNMYEKKHVERCFFREY